MNRERSDQSFVSPDDIDSHLAWELRNMSMEDRSTLFEEIHGVTSVPPEEGSPERMKECLHQMDEEIKRIPDKRAYEEALSYESSFVNDESFRLSFLRADRFDTQKAAARMVLKLDLLSRYFGPVALQRRLTIHDLTEEAKNAVKSGNLQLLPTRDRAGRMIMMRIGSFGAGVSNQMRVRSLGVNEMDRQRWTTDMLIFYDLPDIPYTHWWIIKRSVCHSHFRVTSYTYATKFILALCRYFVCMKWYPPHCHPKQCII